MPRRALIGGLGLLLCAGSTPFDARDAAAADADDPPWHAAITENLRFTLDLASRVNYVGDTGDFWTGQFIGFDLHKVFSGDHGDVGTLVLQGYLTRIEDAPSPPPFFESGTDWEFVYRIFNFNYTRLARNRLNLRVGHFELPFGLEHTVNTNGTLRDYMHGRNLGVKADWGITLNGELPAWEYEFGLSRGTGNEWTSRGDPFIVSGRIGTPRDEAWAIGLSGMAGDLSRPGRPDDVLPRWRTGLDVIGQVDLFTVMSEISFGEDDGADVFNALCELNWTSPDESWLVYVQGRVFLDDVAGSWEETVTSTLGVRWAPDAHWSLSMQWSHDLETRNGASRAGVLSAQVRYRF